MISYKMSFYVEAIILMLVSKDLKLIILLTWENTFVIFKIT